MQTEKKYELANDTSSEHIRILNLKVTLGQ